MPSAVEELLRYESPSQHTARLAPAGAVLGGKDIPEGAAVIAVMGAANRDPERFVDPDRLDLSREDNRHLAFGWAAHFCFGAPLARIEGHLAFEALLARFAQLTPAPDATISWRPNLGLRGLAELRVRFVTDAGADGPRMAPPCRSRKRPCGTTACWPRRISATTRPSPSARTAR